ncbi:MAG: helix-turn-helix domain-containing protein [Actinobacteria bacterium]|nr:helix-turn-helix domain-containing protein [Actinomycetota bacterium]
MGVKEKFGKDLRRLRQERGLTIMQVSKFLGYDTAGYVSDAERGKFVPQPDKLKKWARALGMSKAEMDDLLVEAKLEDIGLSDPGFTIMFKEVPNMTAEEKQSVIDAYESVIKARSAKGKKKS